MPLLILALTGCVDATPPDAPTSPPPAGCDVGVMAHIDGAPFTSLQDALAVAVADDTITLCPGRWPVGEIMHQGANVTLQGATGVAEDVILDGQGVGELCFPWVVGDYAFRDFTIERFASPLGISFDRFEERVSIHNLVVRHNRMGDDWTCGDVDDGTGVDLGPAGRVEVTSSRFEHNLGVMNLWARDAVLLDHVTVRHGEGISIHDAAAISPRFQVDILDSTFEDLGAGVPGVFVRTDGRHGMDLTVRRSTFRRNYTSYFAWETASAALTVTTNTAADSTALIEDSLFDGNVGEPAAHILLQGGWARPLDVPFAPPGDLITTVRDTTLINGHGPADAREAGYPIVVLGETRADHAVRADLINVDIGTGAQRTPAGPAFNRCPYDYEGVISGTIVSPGNAVEDRCP